MFQLLIITKFMRRGYDLEGGSTVIAKFNSPQERDAAAESIGIRTRADDSVRVILVRL